MEAPVGRVVAEQRLAQEASLVAKPPASPQRSANASAANNTTNATNSSDAQPQSPPPVVLPLVTLSVPEGKLPDIKDGWHIAQLKLEREGVGVPYSAVLWWPQVDGKPWDGLCKIRLHGTSSAHFAKHQYSVAALRNVSGKLQKLAVGFGPAWRDDDGFVLHAPYADKSLMRNAVMYATSNAMGRWAPHGAMLEMQVNDTSGVKYFGVYWLFEKVSARRLCMPTGRCEDLAIESGQPPPAIPPPEHLGRREPFLAYCDRNDKRPDRWYVLQWKLGFDTSAFSLKWPEDKKPGMGCAGPATVGMAEALSTALGWDEKPPDTDLVDVDSFIDYLILQELSDNVDGYRFSTYVHRLEGRRIKAGPIWDFDIALGGADYFVNANDSRPVVNHWSFFRNASLMENFYRSALTNCGGSPGLPEAPLLRRRFAERWALHRKGPLSDEALHELVGTFAFAVDVSGAASRNFAIWPMDQYVWPNAEVSRNYTGEVSYLHDWIASRTAWLDHGFRAMQGHKGPWCPVPWFPLDANGHFHTKQSLACATLVVVVVMAAVAALRRRLALVAFPSLALNGNRYTKLPQSDGEARPLLAAVHARLTSLASWCIGRAPGDGHERLLGDAAEAGRLPTPPAPPPKGREAWGVRGTSE